MMKQANLYISMIFTFMLLPLSSTAMGHSWHEPPRSMLRIAEYAADLDMQLAEAIVLAEKNTGGAAIGVYLTMDKQLFMTSANRADGLRKAADARAQSAEEPERAEPANGIGDETPANPAGTDSRHTGERVSSISVPIVFAVVTCVLDDTAVRDVVINMVDGTVLGMQSIYSTERNASDARRLGTASESDRYSLFRATDMMNASARNATNQHVGDIDDLVLDPESNRVVYGVLRRGGFLGFNEARYAVPARMLDAPEEGRILLNIGNEEFEGHSGFDDDKWPLQADSAWAVPDADAQEAPARHSRILRATELIGTNVQCNDGQRVGAITDLIIEPSSGQVIYAIIETERGRLVVPMSAVRSMGKGRIMKMSHAAVTALPTLGDDTEPDWGDPRWNQTVHDRYDIEMTLSRVPS